MTRRGLNQCLPQIRLLVGQPRWMADLYWGRRAAVATDRQSLSKGQIHGYYPRFWGHSLPAFSTCYGQIYGEIVRGFAHLLSSRIIDFCLCLGEPCLKLFLALVSFVFASDLLPLDFIFDSGRLEPFGRHGVKEKMITTFRILN
jgi:hypothetical protein